MGPREFCRLAQVTAGYPPDDSQPAGAARRGARPRKTVTGKMAKFDRFLLFSASLHCKRKTASGQRPKTAEIDQPSEAKRVRTVDFYIFYTSTRPLQSDSVPQPNNKRARRCSESAKQSSLHTPRPAEGLCVHQQRLSVTDYDRLPGRMDNDRVLMIYLPWFGEGFSRSFPDRRKLL